MPPDPHGVRALAERLVAIPSVSPDPAGENRAADALLAALPPAVERGAWHTADGRRVVWGRLRGGSRRTVLLLGHHDTVGAGDDAASGADLAFDPAALRERLLHAPPPRDAALASDLSEERARPGTWLFGRGALDMKSGLAAAVAALGSLAERRPAGDVLLVSTPDEEHESAGMLAAVPELERLRAAGADYAGAINLDYATEPAAYAGVVGKALVGQWVRGVPAHAGDPFAGLDAVQIAAAIVRRLSVSPALRESHAGRETPPPVALKLRDLKPAYDVQTAAEAVIEWNVLGVARPLEETLARIERETRSALDQLGAELRALSGGSAAWRAAPEVRSVAAAALDPPAGGEDARAFTLRAMRRTAAAVAGPVVVTALLPPFYPPALPRETPWLAAVREALAADGVPLHPLYPFISDASYLAWRGDHERALAARMPSWQRGYRLPVAAMRALDLDVVNLGPWGRDAHGHFERAHAPWAFERLPRLIAAAVRAGLDG